jgi:hypothetical protein
MAKVRDSQGTTWDEVRFVCRACFRLQSWAFPEGTGAQEWAMPPVGCQCGYTAWLRIEGVERPDTSPGNLPS